MSDKTSDESDTRTSSSWAAAIIDYICMDVWGSVIQHVVTWSHAEWGGFFPSFTTDVWQAVTAKSPSSFESWSNRLLILASRKSPMVRLEKVWANLVKRWLSLVWEASVLASEFSNFSLASIQFLASEFFNFSQARFSISR